MTDDTAERVTITVDAGVADVRLNRPDKLNALDPAMFDGIIAAIAALGSMPGLRAVVLSGEGRGFCAGLDMASMAALGQSASATLFARDHDLANGFQQVAWGWRMLPVPVIAAVHGVGLGGGFQILSGADIRIVAPDARLSIMEAKWGLIPDMAGIALWRGVARDDVLRELTYTHREFSGEAAVALGLATRTAADPHGAALVLAHDIAARSPDAVRAAKRLFNRAMDEDSASLLVAESEEQRALVGTPNQMEAVMAGMQKRAATFRD